MSEKDFIKVKLPRNMAYFGRSQKDPYNRLYSFSAKKAFGENELYKILFNKKINIMENLHKNYGFTVSNFWVTEKDDIMLNKVVEKWIKKYHPKWNKNIVKDSLMWYKFDRGPACFGANPPKWAKSGYIYIKVPINEQKI